MLAVLMVRFLLCYKEYRELMLHLGTLLRDLRKQVDPSTKLVGVDITKDYLPLSAEDNISYQTFDLCEQPPTDLTEAFDLTHVRLVLAASGRVGMQQAVHNLAGETIQPRYN